jgi:hypothetical protein
MLKSMAECLLSGPSVGTLVTILKASQFFPQHGRALSMPSLLSDNLEVVSFAHMLLTASEDGFRWLPVSSFAQEASSARSSPRAMSPS